MARGKRGIVNVEWENSHLTDFRCVCRVVYLEDVEANVKKIAYQRKLGLASAARQTDRQTDSYQTGT